MRRTETERPAGEQDQRELVHVLGLVFQRAQLPQDRRIDGDPIAVCGIETRERMEESMIRAILANHKPAFLETHPTHQEQEPGFGPTRSRDEPSGVGCSR